MPRHEQKNHVQKKRGVVNRVVNKVVNEHASALEEKIEPSSVTIPLSKNTSRHTSQRSSHHSSLQQSVSVQQSMPSKQPIVSSQVIASSQSVSSDAVLLKDSLQKICYPKVPAEKFFILCTGEHIEHYLQLAHLLGTMADEVFYYHVTESRNDFANWIRDVFNEPQLAILAAQASSPLALRAILYAHIIKKIESSIV